MSYGNVFELNLVTRVDMLRGEIFCESGGVNGRDEKLDWNYVSAGGHAVFLCCAGISLRTKQ